MAALHLIGVVHLDPNGYRKLNDVLQSVGPDTITSEVSPYAIEFRRRRSPSLAARLAPFATAGILPPALQAVSAQLALPFEFCAAFDYAAASGVSLQLLGDSDESRRLLQLFEEELFSHGNLQILSTLEQLPLARQVSFELSRARQRYQQPSAAILPAELRWAKHIRAYVAKGNCVHIGGWRHLANLATLLDDLAPVRLLLDD